MDKIKKVELKQSIHRICHSMKILTFCESLRYLFMGECNVTFLCLIAIYILLFVALDFWEYKDYSVRMYPYSADDEDCCDEDFENEEDEK